MLNLFIKLKKELIELYQKLEGQILESNSFNLLKERYQSLTLLSQKLIKIFLIALFFLIILYAPLYYIASSTADWLNLKEKQKISLELLKMREKSSFSTMRDTEALLKSKIEGLVQKYSSEEVSLTKESKKFPKSNSINQILFKVQVPYLNIRQAVQLGSELEALSQVRLEELSFTENKKYKNHYDIIYQLSAFVIKKDPHSRRGAGKRRRVKRESPIKRVPKEENKSKPVKRIEKNKKLSKTKTPQKALEKNKQRAEKNKRGLEKVK